MLNKVELLDEVTERKLIITWTSPQINRLSVEVKHLYTTFLAIYSLEQDDHNTYWCNCAKPIDKRRRNSSVCHVRKTKSFEAYPYSSHPNRAVTCV